MKIKRKGSRLVLRGASVKELKECHRARSYKRRANTYRDIAVDTQAMYLSLYMKCARLTEAYAKGLDTSGLIKEIEDEIKVNFPVPY